MNRNTYQWYFYLEDGTTELLTATTFENAIAALYIDPDKVIAVMRQRLV